MTSQVRRQEAIAGVTGGSERSRNAPNLPVLKKKLFFPPKYSHTKRRQTGIISTLD